MPILTLEFRKIATPRATGAGDADTACAACAACAACGGRTAGPGARGSPGSGTGRGGGISPQRGTACSALADATERDSHQNNRRLPPGTFAEGVKDKKDTCMAHSHRSPVLPEGDKHRGGATTSPLGPGIKCVIRVSSATEPAASARPALACTSSAGGSLKNG